MLMGAGMFVPVIGMAGLPFLSKAMTEQHLQQAKQKLRPKLTEALEEVMGGFSTRVLDTVSDNIHELRDTAVNRFDELLAELSGRVSEELARRRTSQTESKQVIAELEARKLKLQELINDLRSMNTEAETNA
jgi:AcrR family transcriptional regulator